MKHYFSIYEKAITLVDYARYVFSRGPPSDPIFVCDFFICYYWFNIPRN